MAYPETIAKIDFIPQFFAILFFIMLFVLGIGSNIGMTHCIVTVIRDRFPKLKCWKVVIAVAIVGFSIGCLYTTPGGQFLIGFLDFYGASFVALILAIIELLTVSWIYGVNRFCHDIEFMLGKKTGFYWRFCWGILTPLMMIAILVYFVLNWSPPTYHDYEYHPKMHGEILKTFNYSKYSINFCLSFWLVHFTILPSSTSDLGIVRDCNAEGEILEKENCECVQAELDVGTKRC